MEIKRIGVIGAGQMGSGIAHVCALKGFDIRLMDVDQPHINSGVENIGSPLRSNCIRFAIRTAWDTSKGESLAAMKFRYRTTYLKTDDAVNATSCESVVL